MRHSRSHAPADRRASRARLRLHAAPRERDVRAERARVDRKSGARERVAQRRVHARRAAPGRRCGAIHATPDARHAPSVSNSSIAPDARQRVADRLQRGDGRGRDVADERERQVHVVARDRAAARAAGDVARQRRRTDGAPSSSGTSAKKARTSVWASATAGAIAIPRRSRPSVSDRAERPRVRRGARHRRNRRGARNAGGQRQRRAGCSLRAALVAPATRPEAASRQPLATCSSSFGFSKNCSSSVEFLSAVVDAWLPWIVVVTASK